MTEPRKQWNNYRCSHRDDVENIILITNIIADSNSEFRDELLGWFDDRMDLLMSVLWEPGP
jgi:hypothetical protein